MAKKIFPQAIYVIREQDHDDSFLVAHESMDNTCEVGETCKVAIYKLDKIIEAEGHVRIKGES